MVTAAIQSSGLNAEATAQLLEFLRSNAGDILSFVAPFPELRAWVAWIIDHVDEHEGRKRNKDARHNVDGVS